MKIPLLMLTLVAGAAFGQAPRAVFNWWDSPVARDIGLSQDQTRQIRATIRDFRPKLIDLRANVEKAEIEVEEAFGEENLDQRKASEAIEKLVASRGELTRAISQMSLKLRSVLTTEQWRELQRRRPSLNPLKQPRSRPGPGGGAPSQPTTMKQ